MRAGAVDLRLGRWETVLEGVECDALVVDAPYSERTHAGHDEGTAAANRAESRTRRSIAYEPWHAGDVDAFVQTWAPRTRGWFCSLTDHVLAPAWEAALEQAGRYVFSPIACVLPGSRVRMNGDGPSQWTVWLVVSRPKALHKWGTLPGAYVLPAGEADPRGAAVVGGKPLWLMRQLVRDYSRPGDLICDPCAGGGTTLLAAAIEGRRAVGAEMDPAHFEIADRRLWLNAKRFADI